MVMQQGRKEVMRQRQERDKGKEEKIFFPLSRESSKRRHEHFRRNGDMRQEFVQVCLTGT
jgi:hypothetical protein